MGLFRKSNSSGVNVETFKLSNFVTESAKLGIKEHDEAIQELIKKDKEKGNDAACAIYFEYLYFFMHLINRKALRMLGDEGRGPMLDRFGYFTAKKAAEIWYEGDMDAIAKEVLDGANEAEMRYSKCSTLFPQGEKMFDRDAMNVVLTDKICTILYGEIGPESLTLNIQTGNVITHFHELMKNLKIDKTMKKA